ncbi:peptidylprolyl isomerase [Cellulosilyticum ruminicola]|uniref:peptidylprolyl isomerase n=1 Tax=Cellulosilyticum ruminicola TaxID=425254 RepID=UPI00155D9916|nr:peptidylprolyl isomerase [Cellulosilyticum ruminicola]
MKGKKTILAYILIIVMTAMGVTGCMKSEQTVAIINGEKISEPVYRICLWITQRYFESVTTNIWEMDSVEGRTPEEYAKDKALNSLKLSVVAKQKADELGVKLTKADKKQIKDSAKGYMKDNESFVKVFKIRQKDFEQFLSYSAVFDEVIRRLGENYIPNEDELNKAVKEIKAQKETVTIEHILISNRNEQDELLPSDKNESARRESETVLAKALVGDESTFKDLITSYSEDEAVSDNQGSYTILRGQVDEAIENVAFEKGTVNEVYPQVIETANGYEIIRIVERNFLDDTVAEEEALNQIRTQFATNELNEISETLKIEKLPAYDNVNIMK